MTTKLDPPQVPPLTPAQHTRLRNRVLDQTQPAGAARRRWIAPVAAVGAVAAVAAVAAGTVAVADRIHDQGVPVSETPTATPSVKVKNSLPPNADTDLPLPTSVDLGPVPANEANAAAQASCRFPNGRSKPVQVLWDRRVRGLSPTSKLMILLVKGPPQPGGYYDQGIALCQPGMNIVAVRDTDWAPQPTKAQPLTRIGGSGFSTGPTERSFQFWKLYRAHPTVARIESRYVWKGGAAPWIRGIVTNGYAYTDSRAILHDNSTPTEQVRAYDASGHRIPL
ncbi:hypothetical protein AB0E69_06530 [Kribbella sp. NPDC026611]|uniref:hypothetical protein n=1 Tax=Kribbella sp. NPDC026611 TaxID=3154911 RepID=UPI003403EAA1